MGQMKTIKNDWTFAPVVKHNHELFHPLMIKRIFIIFKINLGMNKVIIPKCFIELGFDHLLLKIFLNSFSLP